ncbi:transcription elongation factor [Boletus reticuloceps]|uniref:Transcription elongation factor n=1 Tax=Boletus reticuloceps TaxID=495285 RepID=A0A8I3A5I4_9AGAM|nr:transcription elongation factor [Boletus reticuloceps]
MSKAAELKNHVKQLQNASNNEDRVAILTILKREFRVNEALLRESKAGLAVGKLRAHESKEVSDLAKEIVKRWKNDVDKAKAAAPKAILAGKPPGASRLYDSCSPSHAFALIVRKQSTLVTPVSATPAPNGKAEVRSSKTDGVRITATGDNTRDRCADLIYDGLACDSGAPVDLITNRALAVEKAVFTLFGGTTPEYKGKIRSLFVNLKDKANPSLRESIVSGDLSPEKFSKMTSEEMMTEERRSADQKIKEENLFKSLGAGEQEAETEGFQCGRCKQASRLFILAWHRVERLGSASAVTVKHRREVRTSR